MKKSLLIAVALSGMLLASCEKENSYHTMAVLHPAQVGVIFADQDLDSVVFNTTDNFQITSDASWASIPKDQSWANVESMYRVIYQISTPVYFEANNTGKNRLAQITVHTFDNDEWDQSGHASFLQLAWPDIYRPRPNYSYNNSSIPEKASFEVTDSATQVADTLKFYLYDKWTLSDGKFVHPLKTTGDEGDNTVALTVEVNPTTGERNDTLKLACRGIETPIAFKQEAPKVK